MTQGFQQPQYGAQPQQFPQQPQGYAPPAQQPMMYGQPGVPAPQFQQPPAQQQGTGGYFEQQQTPPQGGFSQQGPAPAEATDTEGYFSQGAAFISWDSDKGYRDGTPRGGQIVGKAIMPQTDMDTGEVRMSKFNKNQPLTMLVLTVQTGERVDPEDDGLRRMAVRAGLRNAAKKAFEAVGAKDLELGGWFYAARIRKEPIPNTNFKRNVFDAVYARPGAPDPMAGQPAYQAPAQPPQQAFQPPAQFSPIQAQQPGQGFAPQQGPIAGAPAAAMANFQQAAQHDPNVQAAVYGQQPGGFPQQAPPGQFVPGAAVPQQYAPQPGAPMNGGTPQQPAPGQSPAEWTPFSQ